MLPLLNGDRAEGVLIFNSLEKGTFTPEFVELLRRLAENVAFALENFDRADEKAKTEEQKERLTRMFAALSATNEAIMRAKSRAELFELVCVAASAGGKFTSDDHRLGRSRQRSSWHRGRGRTDRGDDTKRKAFDLRRSSGGTRARRHGVPHPAALHQQ